MGGHKIKDCLKNVDLYKLADVLWGRAAAKAHLDLLEEWAHQSFVAFKRKKWQVMYPEKTSLSHQYGLGTKLCYDLRALGLVLGVSAHGGRVSLEEKLGGWKGIETHA